ncbi:ATP-binding protein [Nocardia sp. CA-151230]|uniref:ATP-binding protein n=1 Tax=Nocardia sp. CA-151230 TaxID=3239982 RepID=UPI003D8F86CF
MNTLPLFSDTDDFRPRSELIAVDRALESMRDSGFNLATAIGEPIDNSIEAGARTIRIRPIYSNDKKSITTIAFADDGRGVDEEIMPAILKMGFSTRYGERKGLGRFGVGLKLAALSVAKRIVVISLAAGTGKYHRVFIDLDMVKAGRQEYIEIDEIDGWPAEYADLMVDDKGLPFESGTLVLWENIDRLAHGGRYGTALNAKMAELQQFIARAYREYLDSGLSITLDGKSITLHDPLFLKMNPRIAARYRDYGDEMTQGRVIEEADLDIEGHTVHVTVALVPQVLRWRQQAGGDRDKDGNDIREFQINRDNAGRISIMRNNREIYYDIIPRLLPSGVDKVDRYMGIEVTFPADLDEYFQVRNVKRGAEPVDKLRQELRLWLDKPVREARKEIRLRWATTKIEEQVFQPGGDAVTEAVERAEQKSPKGQAGFDVSTEEAEEKILHVLEDLGAAKDEEKAESIRTMIGEYTITMVEGGWPGKEMFVTEHLNNKSIVTLNTRHSFVKDIYCQLKASAGVHPDDQDALEMYTLIQRSSEALKALLMAYAKAESMDRNPSVYEDLRTYWGQQTQAYLKELGKGLE